MHFNNYEKYIDEILQAMEAIKSALNQKLLPGLIAALQDEKKTLIDHWMSAEFKEKYESYLIKEKL